MGLPVPLELPTPTGLGQVVDTPPVRAVVLPTEVYSSGALFRVRIEHHDPPAAVAEEPAQALIVYPGHEENAVRMLAGADPDLAARALTVVTGATNGPLRWDLEFWWPREQWADVPTPRLSWPVAGLDVAIEITQRELEAAADSPPGG